jgi:hypothetical protein
MKSLKLFLLYSCSVFLLYNNKASAQNNAGSPQIVRLSHEANKNDLPLVGKNRSSATIRYDAGDHAPVIRALGDLQSDIEKVTDIKPALTDKEGKSATQIIAGTIGKNKAIDRLISSGKLDVSSVEGKWEGYVITTINKPFPGVKQALVIAGVDQRGTIFGIYELSRQIGVSPWYWWADVPVKKQKELYITADARITDAPQVKYRGIFINDEAPALTGWANEKFGGLNREFYDKVFELLLRLKGNYIWPAMWGKAFYDDDPANINSANAYGVVIGTSHHEPMMRAHDEWRRYGNGGQWNYETNEKNLKEFWRTGLKRAANEKIVTVGMRGDGDEPMSRETATALLEKIVRDQREIIEDVTGKPAAETPQLWALYKEVQEYYDKGMRVPDDVTLLLCDDNWGNLRKLPKPGEKPRKGGYGIYYHFDYVGGPRNYKWLNTNTISRTWEQMQLAWEHNVREIWLVNVGDIKPMEYPISFFLDYAWNPEKTGIKELGEYPQQWAAAQFGDQYAAEIGEILEAYTRFNSRRKPELLDQRTYSFNYNEWQRVVKEYNDLLAKAEKIKNELPAELHNAYFQLVLHPVLACANLNEMYYNTALNKQAFDNNQIEANSYADKVKELYGKDSLITNQYHTLNGGKWNHMMSQKHIGYTYWQEPKEQKMPQVYSVSQENAVEKQKNQITESKVADYPKNLNYPSFYELDGVVSMEAHNFSRAHNAKGITWQVIPGLGRTASGVTSFPVTSEEETPTANSPYLEYEFYTYSVGNFNVNAYFSPSLNFLSTTEGLQYAVSVDDEAPQIISINKEDKDSYSGIWNKWMADNIIIKTTTHQISKPGKHILKYWKVNPGVVVQKAVLDFGGQKPSYLGPPETLGTSFR